MLHHLRDQRQCCLRGQRQCHPRGQRQCHPRGQRWCHLRDWRWCCLRGQKWCQHGCCQRDFRGSCNDSISMEGILVYIKIFSCDQQDLIIDIFLISVLVLPIHLLEVGNECCKSLVEGNQCGTGVLWLKFQSSNLIWVQPQKPLNIQSILFPNIIHKCFPNFILGL